MLKKIIFISVLSFTILFAQETKKIAFGPYLQNMTTRSATICWSTFESNTKITSPDGTSKIILEYEQHTIELSRLTANSDYEYDVLNNGSGEGFGKFKTYPKDISPFKFVVLGDTRSNPVVHSKIVSGIIRQDPLFVVNTGDMISNGRDIKNWESFFEVNNKLMRNVPYYAVLGNHEKDSPYYYDFFPPPGDNNYYSFSVGDALFVILDSEGKNISAPNYLTDDYEDQFWSDSFKEYFQAQKDWLEKELTLNQDAGFIFVFQHQPLYSIKKSRVEDTNKYREFWGDIFERHNVQFFINGHDHHYHHALNKGVHYITTAGGGAGLYETDSPQPETVKFSKINHFLSVNMDIETATINVIDLDGNEIDKIVVEKRKSNK